MTNTQPQFPNPAAPQTPNITAAGGDSNKMILWFVVGIIAILLLVGGIYLFFSRQQAETTAQKATETIVQTTPKPEETVDALDRDLQSVNIASPEGDLAPIDQDLNQL